MWKRWFGAYRTGMSEPTEEMRLVRFEQELGQCCCYAELYQQHSVVQGPVIQKHIVLRTSSQPHAWKEMWGAPQVAGALCSCNSCRVALEHMLMADDSWYSAPVGKRSQLDALKRAGHVVGPSSRRGSATPFSRMGFRRLRKQTCACCKQRWCRPGKCSAKRRLRRLCGSRLLCVALVCSPGCYVHPGLCSSCKRTSATPHSLANATGVATLRGLPGGVLPVSQLCSSQLERPITQQQPPRQRACLMSVVLITNDGSFLRAGCPQLLNA